MTCNCGVQCKDKDAVKEAAKTALVRAPPAASAHGFVAKKFMPKGGFPTDFGEQAACVLDKTEAVLDLLAEMKSCNAWDGAVGKSCYPESVAHLVRHTEMCCEGREHFVLWGSDTFCEMGIGQFVHGLRVHLKPLLSKCVKSPASCAASSKHAQTRIAKVLQDGLVAASKLFSKAKPGDMTPAAKQLLHTCASSHVSYKTADERTWHDVKCLRKEVNDVDARQHVVPKEDTRRL